MLSKKILSFSLAVGLAFGISLNAGAVTVVSQDILKIFDCESEEELKESFTTVGCVGVVNRSLEQLHPQFESNQDVSELCTIFSFYYDVLRANAAKNTPFTAFEQRDAIIERVANVLITNDRFMKQFDRIINGKTKHLSNNILVRRIPHNVYGSGHY